MDKGHAPRAGNVQRAEWRHKCRQTLADHLREQLGISIEPAMVRLMPHSEDGYTWIRRPEREHLFTKSLSKHSIGAYMELCREIGISFEAIAQPSSTNEGCSKELPSISKSIIHLTSEVDQLQAENDRLTDRIASSSNELRTEALARQKAEAKITELKAQLSAIQIQEGILKQQNQELSRKVERLTKRVGHSDREVKKALSTLSSVNGKTGCPEKE